MLAKVVDLLVVALRLRTKIFSLLMVTLRPHEDKPHLRAKLRHLRA